MGGVRPQVAFALRKVASHRAASHLVASHRAVFVPVVFVPGRLPSGEAGSWLGRPPTPGRSAGNCDGSPPAVGKLAGRFLCKKSPAAPPPGRVAGKVLGRLNSRKSLICPWDGLVVGRFPGRDPTPGVVPRLGSKLGLGLVTPPLGSRVLGSPLLGSRLPGSPATWYSAAWQSSARRTTTGIPKLGRPPLPPIDGNRDGNCPIDGRLRDGMLGIARVYPSMANLSTAYLASPRVCPSTASADSSKERIPSMEQCCVRALASKIRPGSCRLHHACATAAPPNMPPHHASHHHRLLNRGYSGRSPFDTARR